MTKILAIALAASALTACSHMNRGTATTMGAQPATNNSIQQEAKEVGNRSAVSPGGGAGSSGAGAR